MLFNCDVGEYLRVPWTARRSNQSVLKEISPEYSLEEVMLKLQYFGHLMQRSDPDAGKDWRREEKTTSEDEMVGRHHWLSGHEFEQALGVGDGQGSLACCSPWSRRESETTERLNWKETWVLLEDQQKFLGGRYYANKFSISVSIGILSWNPPAWESIWFSIDSPYLFIFPKTKALSLTQENVIMVHCLSRWQNLSVTLNRDYSKREEEWLRKAWDWKREIRLFLKKLKSDLAYKLVSKHWFH